MSARDVTPSSFSAACIRGPTPGSSVTGRERRSGSVVLCGGVWAASTLEVGHAIRPRPDVGTDDPAYLGDELLLYPELLGQFGEELGGRDVPEVQRTACLNSGPHLFHDGRHLPLAAPRPFVRDHLAVFDPQDGPDIEGGSQEAPPTPQAPALREVLKGAHGEEDVGTSDRGLRRPPHVLEVPALVHDAQGLPEDQTGPHLRAPRVKDLDWPVHRTGGGDGRVVGAAELAGDGEHEDVVVGFERLERLDEVPGRGLGGGRKLVCGVQPLVELLVGHVDLVAVGLVWAEVEGERHHPEVRALEHTRREARRGVGDDRGRHYSPTICSGYSGCPPSLISTSTSVSRCFIPSATLSADFWSIP